MPAKPYKRRLCATCKKKPVRRTDALYCSRKCYDAGQHVKEKRTCAAEDCANALYRSDTKYCSLDCSRKASITNGRGVLKKAVLDDDGNLIAPSDEDAVKTRIVDAELSHLKAQNRRLLERAAFSDRVVAAARETLSALPAVQIPAATKDVGSGGSEHALLLFTDHHIGAKFTSEEMGGLNFYNIDEYSKRLKYCVQKTIRFTKGRKDIACNDITVFLGGDEIDGVIHDSLERNADQPPAGQVIVGAHLIAQALQELAANFTNVTVACAPGNHGRFRKPHEMEAVTQNFDTLLYAMCRFELQNQKNIKWSIPQEFWNYQDIAGNGVLLLHGHVGIKGFTGNGTYPGYGLRRSVDNLQNILKRLGKPVRYIAMGHYHSYFCTSHEDGLVTINGSIMGANPYGVAGGFPHRPAVQVLQLFNRKHGMTSQHLLTPEGHGLSEGYKWTRDSFIQ